MHNNILWLDEKKSTIFPFYGQISFKPQALNS